MCLTWRNNQPEKRSPADGGPWPMQVTLV